MLGLTATPERRAEACGACFGPPGEFTAVNSHRMVIALGIDETILWDQFIYSGEPQDFAWLLPVPDPNIAVEIASPDFVDTLDRQTTPQVAPAFGEQRVRRRHGDPGSAARRRHGGAARRHRDRRLLWPVARYVAATPSSVRSLR